MTAWKDLERRCARALGGERSGPLGRHGSDAVGTPFSLETKRCTRYSLRRSWIEQARRQGKAEGRPWLLVVGEHNDHRPIAVLDFLTLVELAERAGMIRPGALADEIGSSYRDARGAVPLQPDDEMPEDSIARARQKGIE